MRRRFSWVLLSHRRRGAGLFVAFVSLAFVQFWSIEGPADGTDEPVGGLLYVAVAGAGRTVSSDPDRLPEIGKRSTQSNRDQRATATRGKTGKRTCPTIA